MARYCSYKGLMNAIKGESEYQGYSPLSFLKQFCNSRRWGSRASEFRILVKNITETHVVDQKFSEETRKRIRETIADLGKQIEDQVMEVGEDENENESDERNA